MTVSSSMAQLGFRTVDEMIGHTECLHKKEYPADSPLARIDLTSMLAKEVEEDSYAKKNIFDFKLSQTKDMYQNFIFHCM